MEADIPWRKLEISLSAFNDLFVVLVHLDITKMGVNGNIEIIQCQPPPQILCHEILVSSVFVSLNNFRVWFWRIVIALLTRILFFVVGGLQKYIYLWRSLKVFAFSDLRYTRMNLLRFTISVIFHWYIFAKKRPSTLN